MPQRTEDTKRARDALGSSSPPASQPKRARSGTRTAVSGSETRQVTPAASGVRSPLPTIRSPSVATQAVPVRVGAGRGGAARGGRTDPAPVFTVKCDRCVSRNERCVQGIGQACLPCRVARHKCSFVREYPVSMSFNLID
jgi:hypothetical protein